MALIGYHASQEQFSPRELLGLLRRAEEAGFGAAMSSDHFHPWTDVQGHSGFTWSWLGAALQASSLPVGVVTTPGYRMHPAVVAQAAATLAEMFPERFWIAIGSGELLNEHITGERWPSKSERNQRLRECADVMRALWAGETVSHFGLVRVDEARLYTRPERPPRLLGAAITPETAEWMGGWADGLITVAGPRAQLAEVVDAFRAGGGRGKPMVLQVHVGYAATAEEALRGTHEQWRTLIFRSSVLSDLRMPAQFEAAAERVQPAELARHVRVSVDLEEHVEWLREDLELGFDEIFLHNAHRDQRRFIDDFGEHVLPTLSAASARSRLTGAKEQRHG